MSHEKEDIIDDPLTDTQRKLRAIVVEAVREVMQEERRRFDWLRFMVQTLERFGDWCNEMANDIKARMK